MRTPFLKFLNLFAGRASNNCSVPLKDVAHNDPVPFGLEVYVQVGDGQMLG